MTWISVPNAVGTDVKYQYRITYGNVSIPLVLLQKTRDVVAKIKSQ
jgi:hypothetical protein